MRRFPPLTPADERLFKKQRRVFLFLDFDGTLAPIVRRPENARVFPPTKKQLLKIIQRKSWRVAIVSGRPLSFILKRMKLSGLIYIGNHGLEIRWPSGKTDIHKGARKTQSLIASLNKILSRRLGSLKGIQIENKIWTLTLHTRRATPATEKKAQSIFNKMVGPYVKKNILRITRGKKVLEARPAVRWDKGKAVRSVLSQNRFRGFPLYIGDDVTDEDAFRELKGKGLTFRVGKGPSRAGYFVPQLRQVPALLKRLALWGPIY